MGASWDDLHCRLVPVPAWECMGPGLAFVLVKVDHPCCVPDIRLSVLGKDILPWLVVQAWARPAVA